MIRAVDILPQRSLTADEARGFRIACTCMATWARQLAAGSPAEAQDRLHTHGQLTAIMAAALERSIGAPPPT